MDFEKANKEYIKRKQELDKIKQELDELRKKLTELGKQHKECEKKLNKAIKAKNKREENKARKELDGIKEDYEKLESDIETKRKEVVAKKEEIDKIIEEAQQDPEVKKSIDEALEMRYNKEISKRKLDASEYEKEQAQLKAKQAILEKLSEVSKENAGNAKKIKDYISALKTKVDGEKDLKDLKDKYAKTGDAKIATKIADLETKIIPKADKTITKNGKDIIGELKKKGLDCTEKALEKTTEEMLNAGLVVDKAKGLDLDKSIDKTKKKMVTDEKRLDKKIKRNDQQLAAFEFSKKQVETVKPLGPVTPPPKADDSLKWYQVGKKFSKWMENRKEKKLPPPPPKTEPETELTDEVLKSELYKATVEARKTQMKGKQESFLEGLKLKEEIDEKEAQVAAKNKEIEELKKKKREAAERAYGE